MKKSKSILLTSVILTASALGLAGCNSFSNNNANTHTIQTHPVTVAGQQQQAQAILKGTGVLLLDNTNDGSNDITLLMPSNIRFASGSAKLSPAYMNILNSVAVVMQEFKYSVAEIPGNADSKGSASYNLALSQKRAQAVADYLISQGIESERLVPKGYGESMPIANNKTAIGRALNRRVHIILHQPPIS